MLRFVLSVTMAAFWTACSWAVSIKSLSTTAIPVDNWVAISVSADVSVGDSIAVAVYADFSGNGTIDGDDFPVAKYRFIEGATPDLVHDGLVYDEDGSENGEVATTIPTFAVPYGVGKYVLQVSDSEDADGKPFEIVEEAGWSQVINGRAAYGGVGKPALIMAVLLSDGSETEVATLTDANGDFSLRVPFPGVWGVLPFVPGKLTRRSIPGGGMATVSSGETVSLTEDLEVFDGPRTISGRVRLYENETFGEGVSDLFLMVESMEDDGGFMAFDYTDSQGSFEIPTDSGEVEIFCDNQNQRGLVVEIDSLVVGDSDVIGRSIEARPITAVISGTVTNQKVGSTVHRGMQIEVDLENGGLDYEINGVYADQNGDYSAGVLAGEWFVGVFAEGLAPYGLMVQGDPSRMVSISDGESIGDVDFTLTEATTFLTIRVREDSEQGPGVPYIEAGVFIPDPFEWLFSWEMDANGEATIPIQPGTYGVNLNGTDLREGGYAPPESQTVTISEGETRVLTLVVSRPSSDVTVTVTDKFGSPIPDADVYINKIVGESRTWLSSGDTDSQGRIVFPLLPGSYETGIGLYPGYPENFLGASRDFYLGESTHHELELRLYPKEATLEVHIEDESGAPIWNAQVYVQDKATGSEILRADADANGDATLQVPAIPLSVGIALESLPPGENYQVPTMVETTPAIGATWRHTFTLLQGLRADINGDGTVNEEDLLLLMREWRQSEPVQ